MHGGGIEGGGGVRGGPGRGGEQCMRRKHLRKRHKEIRVHGLPFTASGALPNHTKQGEMGNVKTVY